MKHGCSVFVGNIDYDVTEEQVVKELSTVGRVVSFKMVYNKATGKSKGYGFCEYESPLVAEMAMKTLKINFNGRTLKINYAENDIPAKAQEKSEKPHQVSTIVSVLDSFEESNLREVIGYLKRMAIDQPSKLKSLLAQNPNLLVALLAALMRLKVIDEHKVAFLIRESFDPALLKDQISERVKNMSEAEMAGMTEDAKYRLNRLKNRLSKMEQGTG